MGLYIAPFRIAHAAPGWIEPEDGPTLGADIINLPNGPLLGGQLPGRPYDAAILGFMVLPPTPEYEQLSRR